VISLKAGDVVTGLFSSAVESKARPAVVLSSAVYHRISQMFSSGF